MISLLELLHGHNLADLPFVHEQNLVELQKRINIVRNAWGRPMVVTSGYRSEQDQRRIYASKGIIDKAVPMGSCHMIGAAVDISDPVGELDYWLKGDRRGIAALDSANLYCEEGTPNWVHFQIFPPASGNRWFKP